MKYPLADFNYVIIGHKVGTDSDPTLTSVHIDEEEALYELKLWREKETDSEFKLYHREVD